MKNKNVFLFVVGCLFILLLILIPYGTVDTVIVTVTGKERITTGSGENVGSKYLIFTETETFQNTDALIFGKFNSSDLYGKLKEGQTYSFKVYGFRIPVTSYYRNIIEVKINDN